MIINETKSLATKSVATLTLDRSGGYRANSSDDCDDPPQTNNHKKCMGGGRITSRILEYYICGHITQSINYVEWFDEIRHADKADIVKLYINSGGGDLFTAIQFMRVLRETNAHVIASVEGACMSAATLIFLSAQEFEVSQHSNFMFHNYSGLTFGKGGEMMDQLLYEKKWSESLLHDAYVDFLTTKEIKSILANKDIWMNSSEVVNRLNIRSDLREKDAALKTAAAATSKKILEQSQSVPADVTPDKPKINTPAEESISTKEQL